MSKIMIFANRNIRKYFRDKGVMVFSFLSVFIVVALYMFFLAQMQIDNVKNLLGDINGIESMIYTWVIGGLLCIPAISVPIIILCFKVDDVAFKTQDDLFVTPIKRWQIMFGYVLTAWIIGFVMTLITFVLCQIFIIIKCGEFIPVVASLKVMGTLALMIFSFSGFSFFIIQFQKSTSSVSVINSILNILLGFFLGLYVPIGMLGDKVALVIKSFPLLQTSAIVRQIVMKDYINQAFKGAPSHVIEDIRQFYGVDIVINDNVLNNTTIFLILIVFGIMFYIASALTIKYRKES